MLHCRTVAKYLTEVPDEQDPGMALIAKVAEDVVLSATSKLSRCCQCALLNAAQALLCNLF